MIYLARVGCVRPNLSCWAVSHREVPWHARLYRSNDTTTKREPQRSATLLEAQRYFTLLVAESRDTRLDAPRRRVRSPDLPHSFPSDSGPASCHCSESETPRFSLRLSSSVHAANGAWAPQRTHLLVRQRPTRGDRTVDSRLGGPNYLHGHDECGRRRDEHHPGWRRLYLQR